MDLLISASFIASFFAGVAALFAPCCITVLLPTYFASIFKKKVKIFLMTFIYFLGLLTIFLPLGFGATILSNIFSQYHNAIFLFGGIFLIFLGFTMLSGKQFSLPVSVHPELKRYDFGSVYVLEIYSAVATTCCVNSSMHRGQFPGHTYIIVDKVGTVRFTKDDEQMAVRNKELLTELDKI